MRKKVNFCVESLEVEKLKIPKFRFSSSLVEKLFLTFKKLKIFEDFRFFFRKKMPKICTNIRKMTKQIFRTQNMGGAYY